jgi:hypothetical protein
LDQKGKKAIVFDRNFGERGVNGKSRDTFWQDVADALRHERLECQ